LLNNRNYAQARAELQELEKDIKLSNAYIRQFVAYAKIKTDEDLPHEQAIEDLYEAICMNRKVFEEAEIAQYRLTDNEINIMINMAYRHSCLNNLDKAICISKALIKGRDRYVTSESERASYLPTLFSNLSTMLGRAGNFKECVKVCNEGIDLASEYNNLYDIPVMLYNLACSLHDLNEEERIYKPLLIRAYHSAYAFKRNDLAVLIKKDAKRDFGIDIM